MFGNRLKKLRNDAGYTIKELSEQLSLKERTYYSYENNEREPDSEILVKIALLFNTSVDYLLGLSQKKDKPSENDLSVTVEKLKQMSDDSLIRLNEYLDYLLWKEEH